MDAATRHIVRERAGNRCEYCLLPAAALEVSLHVEHIVARQHGGGEGLENLALACDRRNLYKGPNLAGIDPATGDITALFNPRVDNWPEHFRWREAWVDGTTARGRATVHLLRMNAPERRDLRIAINLGIDKSDP